MAEATPGIVGRAERGEARRANTTPNGGPHLELGRLRRKTWSKSDLSIAETTGPTYLYTYLYMCFFFFKQKTAYEMLRSLVGSEMCIRDSSRQGLPFGVVFARRASSCSSLPTLPSAASAALVSSPGGGCCFQFLVNSARTYIRTYRYISISVYIDKEYSGGAGRLLSF